MLNGEKYPKCPIVSFFRDNYLYRLNHKTLTVENTLKEEKVGYLKSKANLLQGTLTLTETSLKLEAHKTGVGGMGLLGSILKRKVEQADHGFELSLTDISSITQGKHGLQKNVLEIADGQNTYRMIVKSYQEWENELKSLSKG